LAHAGESLKGLGSVTLKINTQHTLAGNLLWTSKNRRDFKIKHSTRTPLPIGVGSSPAFEDFVFVFQKQKHVHTTPFQISNFKFTPQERYAPPTRYLSQTPYQTASEGRSACDGDRRVFFRYG
jgi:hypothetical protein